MKPAKAVGIQYAALPYRIRRRRLEILLITSRETRRWVIPKGWPIRGCSPPEGAAIEAGEEAGLVGQIESRPAGSYDYAKRLKDDRRIAVQVITFPLRVEDQVAAFKELGQRSARWFSYRTAARLVAEPGLSRLILEFGRSRAPTFAARLGRVWPRRGRPAPGDGSPQTS